jgi:integrase
MDKLQWDLKQLCKRNRDGSFSTQAARGRILDLAARELVGLGYVDMRAQSLKPKHVNALVSYWQGKGLSASTVKNRLAGLRWWAEKVGKPSVVAGDNERLGVADRVYVGSSGKQLALDVDKLVTIENERVRLSLLLQAEFGLRREESIKFQPGYAIRGDMLHLKPSWTKGGRERTIPIITENQRWVLKQVKDVAGKGSMIPPDLTYVQQLKIYEAELGKAGISKAHGLRHAYAQRRYEEITGWKAPHAGGPKASELTPAQKTQDHAARMTISAELGHGREEITAVYLGR